MTRATDDHAFSTEEGMLPPTVVLATLAIIGLFGLAVLYRTGITIL